MDEETKKRIAEIKKREQKARIGPWWVSRDFVRAAAPNTTAPALIDIAEGMLGEDAEFIAHARQDVPFLIDALKKAEKDRETERAAWVEYANARAAVEFWNAQADGLEEATNANERLKTARKTLGAFGVLVLNEKSF